MESFGISTCVLVDLLRTVLVTERLTLSGLVLDRSLFAAATHHCFVQSLFFDGWTLLVERKRIGCQDI
jgi:hypothetical protein